MTILLKTLFLKALILIKTHFFDAWLIQLANAGVFNSKPLHRPEKSAQMV